MGSGGEHPHEHQRGQVAANGWPSSTYSIIDYNPDTQTTIGTNLTPVNALPVIYDFLDGASDCDGGPCYWCQDDNCSVNPRRFTQAGAQKFHRMVTNLWNLRNLNSRKAVNMLLATMTMPETLGMDSNGLPQINQFGKFLASSSSTCNAVLGRPYDFGGSEWEGEWNPEDLQKQKSIPVGGIEIDTTLTTSIKGNLLWRVPCPRGT